MYLTVYANLFCYLFFLNLSKKRHVLRPSWSGRGWQAWCRSLKLLFILFAFFVVFLFFPFYDIQMSRSSHLFNQQVAFIEEVVTRNWSISNCWHLDQKWARSSFAAPVLSRTSSVAASPRTTFTMAPNYPNSGHVNNGSKCTCPHNECFNQWLRDNTTVTTNILLGFLNPSFKFFKW